MPQRFVEILNHIPASIVRFDRQRRIVYANEYAAVRMGRPLDQVIGRTFGEVVGDAAVADHHWARIWTVFADAVPTEYEYESARGEAHTWMHLRVTPEMTDAGEVQTVLCIATDITALKRTEARLRASEERLRLATRAADVGVWEWNVRTGEITWDAEMFRLYGVAPTPAGLVRYDTWSGAVLPDDLPAQEAVLQDTVRRLGSSKRVFRIRRPDGAVRHIEAAETVRTDAAGRAERVVGTNVDVTARVRAEEQLRESEGRFRAFLDHTPAVAWIKGPDGRHQFVSRRMAELFGGADRWLGRTDEEVLPAAVAAVTADHDRRVRDTRAPLEVLEDVPTADGVVRPWLVVKFPIPHADGSASAGGIALDLSEQRKAEEEKRRTEKRLYEAIKLESLGVLAGGIAHDFNNLLTGILGYTSLAQMDLADGRVAAVGGYLRHAEAAAARAADLCQQMLAYSGRGQFQVKAVSLNRLVEEMAALLQTSISKKAVLRYLLASDGPVVQADVTQLRQVVMNLITNASDAIGDRSGVITVSSGAIDADARYLADVGAPHLPPRRYAYLEVSDTGCGMSEEVQARIFEPFFSTKTTGRGLGLSAIQGIVRGHDGWVKVYSAPGRGTTFKVLLPSAAQPADADAVPTTVDATAAGRGRRVLVIDDEEDIRVLARKVLEMCGFVVDTADDGRAGAEAFEHDPARFHAVVCDLTMPHLDGASTFRRIRHARPDVPVVLMSGFSEDETTAGLGGMNLNGFLRKPFRAQELRQTVLDVVGP